MTICCLIALACVVGCAPSSDPEQEPPGELPFVGLNLKLLVVDDPGLAEAVSRLRAEWQATTGAEVTVLQATREEMLSANSLPADAVIFAAADLGELAPRGWLKPIPADSLSDPDLDWSDVFETQKSLEASWGGVTMAIPFGSPMLTCVYRRDLFEKHGQSPPETWAQFQQVAAFFQARENLGAEAPAPDRPWSGALIPLSEGWAAGSLLAWSAAYAKHPDNYSSLFELQTARPLIDGPPFVRALDELRALHPDALKACLTLDVAGAWREIVAGHCAMALTWPPPSRAAGDSSDKEHAGELAFMPLPGAADVYSLGDKAWRKRDAQDDPRVNVLGLAGRLGAIGQGAARPEAAARLLAWLSGINWSDQVSTSSAAATLFRHSHVKRAEAWAAAPATPAEASQYAQTVSDAQAGQDAIGALRLPGRAEYIKALDAAVRRAAQGELESQAALDEAAKEWSRVTQELGEESQRAAWRNSVGLP